jgi:multiple sugar transport system substrate-binding protein
MIAPADSTNLHGRLESAMFGLLGWSRAITLAATLLMPVHYALAETTIRMWTFLDPAGHSGREKVLKQLMGEFEAANPGVRIEVEPQIWQQISDKFLAAHQTGTAPDVTWLQIRRLSEGIEAGALANLDDLFIKNWSPADIADIDDAVWRYGARPGAHYQIMISRSTNGHFYRTDLFKAAGIDPATLTTWDKLIAAARKLTVKDANGNVTRYGYGQFYPTQGANMPLAGNVMLEQQGNLFDDKGNPAWATPAGVKGLDLELDLMRKYGVTPASAIGMEEDDAYDQFNAGRYAIIRGNTARLPGAVAALGPGKVGYMRTPSFTEGRYSPAEIIGWSLAVWSGSKNKELAGKWLEFLVGREADRLWVTRAGMIPIRKSTVADNPDFFAKPENAYLKTAAEEMKSGWLSPLGVPGGFNDELDRAAQDVFVHGTNPQAALKKAEDAFRRRR